jgi:hypothetical protein
MGFADRNILPPNSALPTRVPSYVRQLGLISWGITLDEWRRSLRSPGSVRAVSNAHWLFVTRDPHLLNFAPPFPVEVLEPHQLHVRLGGGLGLFAYLGL